MTARAVCPTLWLVVAMSPTASIAAEENGLVWGAHAVAFAELGVYHFTTQTSEPRPVPYSFTFAEALGGGGLDLELGAWWGDVALLGMLRARAGAGTALGDGPPFSTLSGGADASLGARGIWGLRDGGGYLFADAAPMIRAFVGSQNEVGAPTNVFDFEPLFGLGLGAGLGWRGDGGFDVRIRVAVEPVFNDEARAVPFGLELQVGPGSAPPPQ